MDRRSLNFSNSPRRKSSSQGASEGTQSGIQDGTQDNIRDGNQASTALPIRGAAPGTALPIKALERYADDYLLDCDYRMQSPRTIATRRTFINRLLWFLRHRGYTFCGTGELRQFFTYLVHGHEEKRAGAGATPVLSGQYGQSPCGITTSTSSVSSTGWLPRILLRPLP